MIKLKYRWSGLIIVVEVFLHGAIEFHNPFDGHQLKANGHRLKHYLGGSLLEQCSSVSLADTWGFGLCLDKDGKPSAS